MNAQADDSNIDEAVVIDETSATAGAMPQNIWLHGLTVIVILALSHLALTLMGASAVIQFFWMLLKKERNTQIVEFGNGVAHWLSVAAAFVTGKSDDKPFPWGPWKA